MTIQALQLLIPIHHLAVRIRNGLAYSKTLLQENSRCYGKTLVVTTSSGNPGTSHCNYAIGMGQSLSAHFRWARRILEFTKSERDDYCSMFLLVDVLFCAAYKNVALAIIFSRDRISRVQLFCYAGKWILMEMDA